LTLFPSALTVGEPPPWRFCSRLDRKDWRAVVELEDELLEPVPPRSPINFWNAELSVDKVLDDKVAEESVPLMSWLLLKS
jgi:hypothetical protein